MMQRLVRDDSGVAALELGLLLTVLFLVLGLIYPLGEAFIEKNRLDRTLADSIRFATATPNTPAADADGRRPSAAAVEAAVLKSYESAGGGASDVTIDVTTSSLPGGTVQITVRKKVDLGPLGALLHSSGLTSSSTITVSSSATGREE
jgi:Flp pilus assembly protein TadG